MKINTILGFCVSVLVLVSCKDITEKPVEQHAFKAAEKARKSWSVHDRHYHMHMLRDSLRIKSGSNKDTIITDTIKTELNKC